MLEAVERVLDRLLAEQPSSVHWFRSALPFVRHALQSSEASWRTPDLVSKSVNVIHSASLGLRDCPAVSALCVVVTCDGGVETRVLVARETQLYSRLLRHYIW